MCSLPVVPSQSSFVCVNFFTEMALLDCTCVMQTLHYLQQLGQTKILRFTKLNQCFLSLQIFSVSVGWTPIHKDAKEPIPTLSGATVCLRCLFFCCSSFMTLFIIFFHFQAFLLFSGSGNFGKRRIRSRQWCIQNHSSDKRSSKSMSWVVFGDFLNILWFFPFRFLVSVFGKNQIKIQKKSILIILRDI